MGLVLALDFDETLVDRNPLRWRPHAREVLRALKRAGHTLVLHSARATAELGAYESARLDADEFWRTGLVPASVDAQWDRFAEMRTFLQQEGCWDLFDLVWQHQGKPHCDVFIDDRLEAPNWLAIWRLYGVDSGDGSRPEGTRSLGSQVR